MELQTLQELFVDELKDLYSAENMLVKALPKMAKSADSPDLRNAFEQHLRQTEGHVARIEQVCQQLGESPRGKSCKGMSGLIEEGDELMKEDAEPEVLDAGLISAAQRVEHYEIAGYGTCCAYARQLGLEEAANLLAQTLEEEKATDKKLTELAYAHINMDAIAGTQQKAA
jgi:ferritin-like metal-binding protein YciE